MPGTSLLILKVYLLIWTTEVLPPLVISGCVNSAEALKARILELLGALIRAPEDHAQLTTCESCDVAIGDTQSSFPRLGPSADN
jgi:hypothetical protein